MKLIITLDLTREIASTERNSRTNIVVVSVALLTTTASLLMIQQRVL